MSPMNLRAVGSRFSLLSASTRYVFVSRETVRRGLKTRWAYGAVVYRAIR